MGCDVRDLLRVRRVSDTTILIRFFGSAPLQVRWKDIDLTTSYGKLFLNSLSNTVMMSDAGIKSVNNTSQNIGEMVHYKLECHQPEPTILIFIILLTEP